MKVHYRTLPADLSNPPFSTLPISSALFGTDSEAPVLVPWNTETLVNPHTLCISRHSRFPANVQNVLLPLYKTCRWKKGHIWREISYLEQGGILLLDLTEKCPADIEQYHLRAHLWKNFDKMMIWHKTLSQSEVQEKVTSGCYCEKA